MKQRKIFSQKSRNSLFQACLYSLLLAFVIFSKTRLSLATSPSPTPKATSTPIASPSATLTPSSTPSAQITTSPAEEEKVQEIRQAIQEKLTQIKEKIEKRAFVGNITEITDLNIILSNFRGKRRIRLNESTQVILANKKEGSAKDLAIDDKIIALGDLDTTETLEAKRIIVVPPPKTPPVKRLVFLGIISETNNKNSTLTITSSQNANQKITIKVSSETSLSNPISPQDNPSFKSLSAGQKILAVFPQTEENKTPTAKTLFLLTQ